MPHDANELLKLYLGTDVNGGFQPLGGEQRIKEVFPTDYETRLRSISPYLSENYQPDWKHDLPEAATILEGVIRRKFPELEAVVVKSLANRFSYGWR